MNKQIAMLTSIGALISLVLLTGCADEKILEKVGFVRTIAIDKADDESSMLRVTISIPKVQQNESIMYTVNARTFKEAKFNMDRQNDRRLVNGQLRQVLFGEKLAREGVKKHLDSILRDPSVGIHAHVLVVEGDIESLLSRKYEQGGTSGEYIDNLLRSNTSTRDSLGNNIHSFIRDYYDDGIESTATLLKQSSEGLTLDGIALFYRDQYVGKIDAEDSMFFGLLHGPILKGDLFLSQVKTSTETVPMALSYIKSKRKVIIESIDGIQHGRTVRARIDVRLEGSLLEYYGTQPLENDKVQRELEKAMETFIQSKLEEIMSTLQEKNSDVIGVGQYVRNAMPHASWKKLDWKEAFKRAEIKVRVVAHIRDYGKLLS